MDCRFRPTRHARQRLVHRGISRIEAMDAIRKGAKRRQGSTLISLHRRLVVVWKQRPCRFIVITAMWEED